MNRYIDNLVASFIWMINVALVSTVDFGFEKAWLFGILAGVFLFAVLSLIEDEEWHEMIVVIFSTSGLGFIALMLCFIILGEIQ